MNQSNNLLKRIFITVILCLAYKAGFQLQMLQNTGLHIMDMITGPPRTSLFAIGLTPVLTGYFIIEIVFLIFPPLNSIRDSGIQGRKIINDWALGFSFLLAVAMAWSLVSTLSGLRMPDGSPLIHNLSFFVLITHTLFFLAGFALLIYIGHLISKHGIANGFCVLLAIPILESLYYSLVKHVRYTMDNNIRVNYIGFLLLIIILVCIFKLIKNLDWKVPLLNEKIQSVHLPFFVQGVSAIVLGTFLYTLIDSRFHLRQILGTKQYTWEFALGMTFLTIIASAICYWLTSSSKRVAASLGVERQNLIMGYKPFIQSTVVIAIITFAWSMPFPYEDTTFIPGLMSLATAITLIAFFIDLGAQVVFTKNCSNSVEIIEFDNIFLASAVKDKLDDAKISHCIQSYNYRRLYFIFQPFIKMKVFVDRTKQVEAKTIIESLIIKNI
jgi:preprotein translocase subunit SecY